jgi:hypothetical protein
VPEEMRKDADAVAEKILNDRLPDGFPGKNLKVVHDGDIMKIIGDLAL